MLDSRLTANPTESRLLNNEGKADEVGVEAHALGHELEEWQTHVHTCTHKSWSFWPLLLRPVYVYPTVRVPNR